MTKLCPICEKMFDYTTEFSLWLNANISKDVVRCSHCRSFFLFPTPSFDEIAFCYVGNYRLAHQKAHLKNKARGYVLGKFIRRLNNVPKRFLDVGCSIGSMMQGVVTSSHWTVFGLEFATDAKEICLQKGLDVIQESLYHQTQWPPNFFGFILANNVLEHEPNPIAFMQSISTLLAPNGLLHLVIPNGLIDLTPTQLTASSCRATTVSEGHLVFFSEQGLRELLNKVGLEIQSIRPFHFLGGLKKKGIWPGSLQKWRKKLDVDSKSIPILPSHSFLCSNSGSLVKNSRTNMIEDSEQTLQENVQEHLTLQHIVFAYWARIQKNLQSFLPLSWCSDWEIVAKKREV